MLSHSSAAAVAASSSHCVQEVYSGRITLKIELQTGLIGQVIFHTDIEIAPCMTVKALPDHARIILFDNSVIAFEMVIGESSLAMHNTVVLEVYKLKMNDVIRARNVAQKMADNFTKDGDGEAEDISGVDEEVHRILGQACKKFFEC